MTLIARRALLVGALATLPLARAAIGDPRWVGAWAAAPQDFALAPPAGVAAALVLRNVTLRQRITPSIGGASVRVRLSNVFGGAPLSIAQATVALSTGADAVSPASLLALRFGAQPDVTIAPGAQVWSDAAPLAFEAGQTLAVSLYLDRPMRPSTVHAVPPGATLMAPGNAVAAARLRSATVSAWNHIVTGVSVPGEDAHARVVVAFGDSITQGDATSYPERLAARLRGASGGRSVAVLNAGIGGNRLLTDRIGPRALDRFERDVLAQDGVTHTLILIGINDIGFGTVKGRARVPTPDATALTAGLQQLVERAQAKGVKVLLGTLLPFKGAGTWSEDKEARRQAVNRWIRGRQSVDAVVDFDTALRSRDDPLALTPAFDSGDHLHPNAAGQAAMAAAVDLRELQE